MSIDYHKESEKYKPSIVKTLLVGEAPPPSEKAYFYVPQIMNPQRNPATYVSLPATIFNHYFKQIPGTIEKYEELLTRLKEENIFLIDLLDLPLKIRDRSQPKGINEENYNILINEIPKLRDKIKNRGIEIDEENIIFLLARNSYKKLLQKEFPKSKFVTWKYFRVNSLLN